MSIWRGDNIEVCRSRYTDREKRLTGRARLLMQRADQDFPNTIDCFDVDEKDMKSFRNKLNKSLEKSGIKCKMVINDDVFKISDCRLTEKYMKSYGKNYNPITDELGSNVGLLDMIEVDIVINKVMDDKNLTGRVIHNIDGWEIIIRSHNDSMNQIAKIDSDDTPNYDDIRFKLVKELAGGYPIFYEDVWKPERGDAGRYLFWNRRGATIGDGAPTFLADNKEIAPFVFDVQQTEGIDEERRTALMKRKFGTSGVVERAEEYRPVALSERLKERGRRKKL